MVDTSEKNLPILISPAPKGNAVVRHYRDGSLRRAVWDADGLKALDPAPADTATDLWIAPGLFDVQVNGYGGVDFQNDLTAEDLLRAAAALLRDGCPRTLLTLITCPWDHMLRKVGRLRELRDAHPVLRRAFPGWHIEGPFLSDQPGFSGAHNPRWMCAPTPEHVRQLKAVVGNDPLLMTFAPERDNSPAAIAEAVRCGFVVSFGHTDASVAQIRAGVDAGGRGFTHLGNGCPQKLDRHDNILWRVLDQPALQAGLIPDTHHVSPLLFRTLHRALGAERIYWTTDAMAAAGAPDGNYTVGEIALHVGPDRVARNPATNTFAGSALEPIEGIRRGAGMLGLRWQDVWDFFSVQPARLMNLPGELAPGSPAGFCLLKDR